MNEKFWVDWKTVHDLVINGYNLLNFKCSIKCKSVNDKITIWNINDSLRKLYFVNIDSFVAGNKVEKREIFKYGNFVFEYVRNMFAPIAKKF